MTNAIVDVVLREPEDVYHAQSAQYLTSHQLADFRRCPLLYYKKKLGLIEEEDRPAYLIGRALHTLVLEGCNAFEEKYAVGGPINPRTGEMFGPTTKAFAEWAAQQGKPVLTVQQHTLVQRMAEGIRWHDIARDLLSDGIPEGVVRVEYCGTRSQVRMDWLHQHQGIVELKTCDDLDWFEADARRYSYVHQLAFYRAVLAQAIGVLVSAFFIAVEKKEPFRCGAWKVHDETLAQAQRENEAAIERLRQCIANDAWPTGYETLRVFDAI